MAEDRLYRNQLSISFNETFKKKKHLKSFPPMLAFEESMPNIKQPILLGY